MDKSSSSSSGIGFFGLLQVLFIGLKLAHVIDWSWWWIMSPAIGCTAFVVVILIVFSLLSILFEK